MAKVIVADENEGRRGLLANTLEREGFEITRAGTLRQAEGTALAIMPEVVLIDSEWKNGDAIDASQRLMSDPEFAFKCRIVILSRNTSQEYLVGAAQAGVAEVMGKPIDMSALVDQLHRHTRKQFVPPPAEVNTGGGTGGTFDVSMAMGDSKWALPMLKGLVGPEKIDSGFINEILGQMGEEGLEVNDELDPSTMSAMLRLALNKLVGEADGQADGGQKGPSFSDIKRSESLGKGKANAPLAAMNQGFKSSMEDILEAQAQGLAQEVEDAMDGILDESPELITIHQESTMTPIDPEVLKLTRLTTEFVSDLMWNLGRPGAVSDITLMTQVEDAAQMLQDVLESLPAAEEEE
ncbi:MAG: response regulator [Candidatus Poseidoniaceae archaeon]|nr:response regulator [Candidatus Poseidoniaceae archaeon]MDG1559336.1 response regulator [Candidatus Poseidoniaceae archaeon]